jgi:parvulin-like peptidyl-prolyl isomerase
MKRASLLLLATLLVLPLLAVPASAQIDFDAVLARVGDRVITVRDFVERYESTPWLGRERRGLADRHKIEFMASLVAEVLLALDAEAQGMEWQPTISRTVAEIERLNVLDALYRKEVIEPVALDDRVVDATLAHFLTEVSFRHLVFDHPESALERYEALRRGVPFDSLAAALGAGVAVESRRWSEFVPEVEAAIYADLTPGRIVQPIEVDGKYYIIQIVDFSPSMPEGLSDMASARERVRKTMQWRAEQRRLNGFLREFSAGKGATVHGPVVQELASVLGRQISEMQQTLAAGGEHPYPVSLGGPHYAATRLELDGRLQEPVISAPGFTLSIDYVLDRIAFKGFTLDDSDETVSGRLTHLLQTLIHEEYLAREGFDRSLDEHPEVRREVERWQRAHMAFGIMKEMALSRPESADRRVYEVNVQEVVSRDLETADALLREVVAGADIGRVAREHSVRADAGRHEGVSGYFRTDQRGDLGMAASIVDVGSLFGPIEVDGGYSFFRLLDRRPVRGEAVQDDESVSRRINERVARLAREHPVDIDLDLLHAVPTTHINKMVYRYMGFGNRMPAAPSLYRMVDWLDLMEESERPIAL